MRVWTQLRVGKNGVVFRSAADERTMTYFRLLAFTLGVLPAMAGDFYVSASGSSQGNGSAAAPWNLATALNATSQVQPGDRVWIRGGTYKGTFVCRLMGSAAAPIIVRNYQNERVILDGSLAGQT